MVEATGHDVAPFANSEARVQGGLTERARSSRWVVRRKSGLVESLTHAAQRVKLSVDAKTAPSRR